MTFSRLSKPTSSKQKTLHQAATELDSEVVLQLLGQMPEAHSSLKAILTEWLHHFRFDQIIQLTQHSTSLSAEG